MFCFVLSPDDEFGSGGCGVEARRTPSNVDAVDVLNVSVLGILPNNFCSNSIKYGFVWCLFYVIS